MRGGRASDQSLGLEFDESTEWQGHVEIVVDVRRLDVEVGHADTGFGGCPRDDPIRRVAPPRVPPFPLCIEWRIVLYRDPGRAHQADGGLVKGPAQRGPRHRNPRSLPDQGLRDRRRGGIQVLEGVHMARQRAHAYRMGAAAARVLREAAVRARDGTPDAALPAWNTGEPPRVG